MSSQDTILKENYSYRYNGKILNFSKKMVMGIINLSPDSFYSGSINKNYTKILGQIEKMLKDGATIIDLGAVSTRPGAKNILIDEEMRRLLPALKLVRATFPEIFISVDTFNADVAMASIELGTDIINDVYAGNIDKKMLDVIANSKITYIAMHMKGTMQTMQIDPTYKNVTAELNNFFKRKIEELKAKKINNIIIDPGFGFGKTVEHNYKILKDLGSFKRHGIPVLVGLSRKSMINNILKTNANKALNGTTVLNAIALLNGANILRVHDVKEAIQTIKLIEYYKTI